MKYYLKVVLAPVLFIVSHASIASFDLKPCMESQCIANFIDMKKYARHSIPMATEALANFYMHGYGTEQDYSKALRYYERTAKHGSATAQFKTGLMYIHGLGKKNIKRGVKWMEWAVKNGHYEAAYILGLHYYHGDILEKNDKEAFKWFEIAAKNNHAKAQFTVGQFYEAGHMVNRDDNKAVELYQESAYKNQNSIQRLVALNKDVPAQEQIIDDGVEHIEINSMQFQEMVDLKLAGMKNIEVGGYSKSPRAHSCKKSTANCSDYRVISDKFLLNQFFYQTNVRY